ncbi:MAG: V-type ATPase subunit [Gemmatimonadales bacterium]|nr:V-type ATPase subunit [Gemmatimonadales bacterium]
MRWDDVNARAVGLATHLLRREQLLRLLESGTWLAAVRRILDFGVPIDPAAAGSPGEFDRAIGRVTARRLAILDRWLGPRRATLAVVYEDEDRRSLRVLLRGAAHGAAPTERLRALVPTPGLPERALARLAQAASPDALIRELTRHGHPAGRALAEAARRAERDGAAVGRGLFGLETALARSFATRATRAARAGGRLLREFAAAIIDRENAWSLLTAAGWAADVAPDEVFLPGGRQLSEDEFRRIAALGDADRIRDRLAVALSAGPLAPAFADRAAPMATLERRTAAALQTWFRALGRRDPLGPGVLFGAIERIRAEAHDLRLVLGGLAMGATTASVEPLLVTTS